MLGPKLLEVALQQSTHGDDAICHTLDLTKPLLVELGVVEDLGCNARAVDGRVGVHGAHEDLDLRIDALLLLDGLSDEREGADTLTVETLFKLD